MLPVGSPNNLNSYGQALRRFPYGNNGNWITKQVVVLTISHGMEVIRRMSRAPSDMFMPESGAGANGRQQYWQRFHALLQAQPQLVAFQQRMKQSLSSQRRILCRHRQKFFQIAADFVFPSADHGPQK